MFLRPKRRFEANNIYTNVADVLVSINPYTDIPGLYDIPMPVSVEQPSGISISKDTDRLICSGRLAVWFVVYLCREDLRSVRQWALNSVTLDVRPC